LTTTATSQSSLGAFLEDTQTRSASSTQESQTSSFQEYMEEAADTEGVSASGDGTASQRSSSSDESSISAPASGQQSRNGTAALASTIVSTASAARAEDAPSATDAYANSLEGRSIEAVRQAMVNEGLDPDSVKMTYSSEFTWTPDGGRINNFLTVETDKGRKLGFSAELSLDNPQVTVCDVRHMLDGTSGWDQWDQVAQPANGAVNS